MPRKTANSSVHDALLLRIFIHFIYMCLLKLSLYFVQVVKLVCVECERENGEAFHIKSTLKRDTFAFVRK